MLAACDMLTGMLACRGCCKSSSRSSSVRFVWSVLCYITLTLDAQWLSNSSRWRGKACSRGLCGGLLLWLWLGTGASVPYSWRWFRWFVLLQMLPGGQPDCSSLQFHSNCICDRRFPV